MPGVQIPGDESGIESRRGRRGDAALRSPPIGMAGSDRLVDPPGTFSRDRDGMQSTLTLEEQDRTPIPPEGSTAYVGCPGPRSFSCPAASSAVGPPTLLELGPMTRSDWSTNVTEGRDVGD